VFGNKSDPLLAGIGYASQITQTSVNGRPAFQYRRVSDGLPPGACGVFLVIDDASAVQIEWHAGAPCTGDQTRAEWDQVLTMIESRLPAQS